MIPKNKTAIGIAFSGGGARGIAHAGVLQYLEEIGVYPQAVSGTSAGAIAGALYAAGLSPAEILDRVKVNSVFKVFNFKNLKYGLSDLSYLREILNESIPHDDFAQLKIPFYACATNLNVGDWEVFSEGSVADAVVASSSIPVVFHPVVIKGHTYVDGGLLNNLPVEPLLEKNLKIIGVNINIHGYQDQFDGMFSITKRIFDLALWANTESRFLKCDLGIDVQETYEFGIFDFDKHQELFDAGYTAARKHHDQIIDLVGSE